MALVNKVEKAVFDTSLIAKGDLVYVEHENWNEPRKGIVVYASDEKVVILYYPDIANVTNRQVLLPGDIMDGGYRIRWTTDMVTIQEYETAQEEQES